MKKAAINAILDILCLLTFIPSLVSGIVLLRILPSGGLGGQKFLGIARSQWLNLHDGTSLLFAALVIIHLLFHWRYFRYIDRYLRSRRE